MLLITKRRQVGAICGHTVYAVSESTMIPLPNSPVQSSFADSRNENRLLQTHVLPIRFLIAKELISRNDQSYIKE